VSFSVNSQIRPTALPPGPSVGDSVNSQIRPTAPPPGPSVGFSVNSQIRSTAPPLDPGMGYSVNSHIPAPKPQSQPGTTPPPSRFHSIFIIPQTPKYRNASGNLGKTTPISQILRLRAYLSLANRRRALRTSFSEQSFTASGCHDLSRTIPSHIPPATPAPATATSPPDPRYAASPARRPASPLPWGSASVSLCA